MPQDFFGQNLRGRSFKGQNLSGANFSDADIRGADFTNAKLIGANFTGAKAGLQRRWTIGLEVFLLALTVVSELSLALAGILVEHLLTPQVVNLVTFAPGGAVIIIFVIFSLISIFREPREAFSLGYLGLALAVSIVVSLCGYFSLAQAGKLDEAYVLALGGTWALALGGTWALAGALAGAFTVGGRLIWALFVVGMFVVITLVVLVTVKATGTSAMTLAVAVASLAGLFLGSYFSWRALVEDEKFSFSQETAIAFAATGGTSFRGADLTNADFTSATLKSTDFRGAILTRTCWTQVKQLDRMRPGKTYLKNVQLRQWLIGNGQNKNFDRQDLRGVNLKGANLADASFIGADLSEANLQDADLSRAKLVQTQLDETDLTGATLTGAYIEDWGITSDTKFHGVKCEYVYMRLPTKENPEPLRKPDNRQEVFNDGDFADFIQPIFDTLDLYHNQGVDPRAIAIAFKQLAENNPEAELEIVAIEKRGQDKLLLRVKTAVTADKSQLSKEYFISYSHLKALAEQEIQSLIAEKDSRIRSLEIMVVTALARPSYYSSTQIKQVGTMTHNPGGFSVGGSVGGGINNVQGSNNRTIQGNNNQGVLGDNNQVTQQHQVGADAEAPLTKEHIVKLLAELETLIRGAELPEDTKEEAIEDLSAAKKATDKEEPKKNVALANLESMTTTLEKASKTVDAGQTLWSKAKPIVIKVAGWLGAAAGSYLLGL